MPTSQVTASTKHLRVVLVAVKSPSWTVEAHTHPLTDNCPGASWCHFSSPVRPRAPSSRQFPSGPSCLLAIQLAESCSGCWRGALPSGPEVGTVTDAPGGLLSPGPDAGMVAGTSSGALSPCPRVGLATSGACLSCSTAVGKERMKVNNLLLLLFQQPQEQGVDNDHHHEQQANRY